MRRAKILLNIILISIFSASVAQAAKPLALRKIMQDMGENMQSITDGISHEDWKQVQEQAILIADHPQPPFGEKLRILSYVGTNARKFKKFDGLTHDAAILVSEAAILKDGTAVIQTFSDLQVSCLECHQTFRKPFLEKFYGD